MKKLMARILGNYLEGRAGLYKGSPTKGRSWYKSKTILSGIAIILRGVYEGTSVVLRQVNGTELPPIPPIVDTFLLALLGTGAVKGRIEANKPIVMNEKEPLNMK